MNLFKKVFKLNYFIEKSLNNGFSKMSEFLESLEEIQNEENSCFECEGNYDEILPKYKNADKKILKEDFIFSLIYISFYYLFNFRSSEDNHFTMMYLNLDENIANTPEELFEFIEIMENERENLQKLYNFIKNDILKEKKFSFYVDNFYTLFTFILYLEKLVLHFITKKSIKEIKEFYENLEDNIFIELFLNDERQYFIIMNEIIYELESYEEIIEKYSFENKSVIKIDISLN
jgi:hypothetical protein